MAATRRSKLQRVLHEFEQGELHSGSKRGPVVKSRKQAIAIGLEKAREAGEAVPPRRVAKGHYGNRGGRR